MSRSPRQRLVIEELLVGTGAEACAGQTGFRALHGLADETVRSSDSSKDRNEPLNFRSAPGT